MKKIFIEEDVYFIIKKYFRNYLNYYKELYSDTGIFGEEDIIDFYKKESIIRRNEIISLIINKLSDDFVKYKENKAVIKWRSKYLIVTFYDENDNRIISDLEIR